MPNWKKVITSGSNASLESVYINTDATISGSLILNGESFNNTDIGKVDSIIGTGSVLVDNTDPQNPSIDLDPSLNTLITDVLGTIWYSGLAFTPTTPTPTQTLDYSNGIYYVNGVENIIASSGNLDLSSYFTALLSGEKQWVAIVGTAGSILQVRAGTPASGTSQPNFPPLQPDDVCLYYVFIKKSAGDIDSDDLVDCRRTIPGTAGTDRFVRVSSNDTTSKTLDLALSNSGNVQFTVLGAPETNQTIKADVNISYDRILYVGKNLSTKVQYTSIKDAIDSITDNAETKRYLVYVGPGEYIEDTITMKPYVDVSADGNFATKITVNQTSKDCIILAPNSSINNFTIGGSTDTGKAIYTVNSSFGPGVACEVNNCTVGSTHTIYRNTLTTGQFAIVSFINCPIISTSSFSVGYDVSGLGNTITLLLDTRGSITSTVSDFVHIRGAGNRLVISNCAYLVQTALGGSATNFVRFYNGAIVDINSIGLDAFGTALNNENTGAAATLRVLAANIVGSLTNDINIAHPSTSGYFNGVARQPNVTINASNTLFNLTYSEPAGGFVISGKMKLGETDNKITTVSPLILDGGNLGLYEGGLISSAGGLTASVASGKGYLYVTALNTTKYIEFNANTNLVIPANSIRYIFVDENGTISSQASQPNLETRIILGRVITDDTSIVSINNTPVSGKHYSSEKELFNRDILKTTFKSGGVVSISTPDSQINVTAGVYYFSNNRMTPTGGNNINFNILYRKATPGQWNYLAATQTVPSTLYDDGTGTLAAIPATHYVKHSLYVNASRNGTDEKYFLVRGQETFATLVAAQTGNSPTPPDGFTEGITILADIIMLGGTSTIQEIKDRRDFLGTGTSGGGAGATDHGALTGLADDDHTQYILVDGTRAFTGNINAGNNNITNVNLVDGVDVSTHASRHLPNGADPLTTGTPISIGTLNSVGIANSFARSDHQHDHGTQGGGTLHSDVTTSVSGFMSGADKTKLDGIAANANNYVHPNHTGDVTSTGDGATVITNNAVTTAKINNNAVDNTKLSDMAVNTIKGRITAGTGDPEDLTATQVRTIINVADGANNYVHPNHTGDVTSTGDGVTVIGNNVVTYAKMQDVTAASRVIGRGSAAGAGDPQELTLGSSMIMNGTVIERAALTGDVTASQNNNATTITNNVVTNAKLAQVATQTFKGRTTAATGNVEDLTATQATAMLDTFTSSLKGLVPASGGGTTNFLRADGTFAPPPGGSDLTTATVQTTTATQTTVQTITGIPTANTTYIEVYIKTYQTNATNWGIWKRTVIVTREAGAPTIQFTSADIDKSSTGLNANNVTFTVSGNDILVRVTGIAATTLNWTSKYRFV